MCCSQPFLRMVLSESLMVLSWDFIIHLNKPQAADFQTLLTSFDLKRVSTTATLKSGNQLDLIYTQHCSTDHVLVTLLHTSDHFLLTFNLKMIPVTTHTPSHVTFWCDLCSLSPSLLSAMVSSMLPPPKQLSSLDTDTFCSTLTSIPGQPVPPLLPLGYLMFSANIALSSGLQKGYGVNHKILLTLIYIDNSSLTSLLMSPLLNGHTIMTKLTIFLTLACSVKHFPPSFVLPPSPPLSSLTADNFATFFINKITNLTGQLSTPKTIKHIISTNISTTRSHTFLHSLRQMSLNSSFPVILLLIRLILFHLISFKPFLLQLYLHLLTSLTHPFILEFFPPAF